MPIYKVVAYERRRYTMEVDCESAAEAKEIAAQIEKCDNKWAKDEKFLDFAIQFAEPVVKLFTVREYDTYDHD